MADQSDNVIFQVEDAENVEVMFEEQRIIFTCSQPKLINNKKSNEMKKYRNEIDLFGKVKPAVSIQTIRTVLRVDQGLINRVRLSDGHLARFPHGEV